MGGLPCLTDSYHTAISDDYIKCYYLAAIVTDGAVPGPAAFLPEVAHGRADFLAFLSASGTLCQA